ncbi:MAG: glycosyltransferase family 39 protein [Nitrospirae bacterium]|nr:glycosyltransferase family 39 protein [Nitrospirota bacterium]
MLPNFFYMPPQTKKSNQVLLVVVFSLAVFVLLFTFRSFDDNRLTNWSWVFTVTTPWKIYLILLIGIILAYMFSRFSLSPTFLFIASFAFATLFWQEPEVIVDAGRYFTQAKHIEMYGIGYFVKEWGRGVFSWTDLPLMPFLYGVIFKIFGETRLFIQVFNTCLFSLTVLLTYQIGKDLWDDEVGIAGGVLLMGIPYLFTQVPLMLVDTASMFFLTSSVFTFRRALVRGKILWIGLSSLAIFLSILSKYSLLPMLSVLSIVLLVEAKNNKPAIQRAILIVFIAGAVSVAIFLYKYDFFRQQFKLIFSYQKAGLQRWSESYLSTFLFQIHPFITAFSVYSIYRAFKKRDLKYAVICYLPLLMVLMDIKRIRYVIPLFPMLTLMASYGLREIRAVEVRRFIMLAVVTSSLAVAIFAYLPFLRSMTAENLKEAGRFIDSLDVDGVEVFTLEGDSPVNPAISVSLFDIHTRKRILYNYHPAQPPEDVLTSALRFTWEYENPKYYVYDEKDISISKAVVIISGRADSDLPQHIRDKIKGYNSKEFISTPDVFRYQTMVKVYWL